MNWQAALALARRHSQVFLFLLLGAAFMGWMTWETCHVRVATYSTRADYWEHSAAIHALIENPWHPRNPHLSSDASSPRFGPQFLIVALLTRALHGDALFGMSAITIFNCGLLVLGIYVFFWSYFRDRLAPSYALIVMLAGSWNAWGYSNVYQLHVLSSVASYPSATALGLTLLGFALTLRILRASVAPKSALVLLGLLVACVVIVHPLTAVMALSGMGLLTISEPGVTWPRRAQIYVALSTGCLLVGLWPYFSVWQTLVGGGGQELAASRPGHRLQEFYNWFGITNALGLALVGVLFLPYFLGRTERLFVGLGALSMLLPFVVNIYRDLPLGHRFILLAIFYLHVGVVWLLLIATPGSRLGSKFLDRPWRRWLARASVAAVLGVFAIHNVNLAKAECLDDPHVVPSKGSPYVLLARETAAIARGHSVVLTDAITGWPIPTFGPKVVTLYHGNPLVLDERERETAAYRFLNIAIGDDERQRTIARYGITHVLMRRPARGALGQFLARCDATTNLLSNGYYLYTVAHAPVTR